MPEYMGKASGKNYSFFPLNAPWVLVKESNVPDMSPQQPVEKHRSSSKPIALISRRGTLNIPFNRKELYSMAMGKRTPRQQTMWVNHSQLPKGKGHPFYTRLNELLAKDGFDAWAIAWNCQDRLSLRAFLGIALHEPTPDHSSLTIWRQRLSLDVYRAAFQRILAIVHRQGLILAYVPGVDSTHLAYKSEHAIDLSSGALLAAEIHAGGSGDATTMEATLTAASDNLASLGDGAPEILCAMAYKRYHKTKLYLFPRKDMRFFPLLRLVSFLVTLICSLAKWGASLLVLLSILLAAEKVHAVSFDCGKVNNRVEKMICADADLSKLDDKITNVYRRISSIRQESDVLRQAQNTWLQKRNRCADVACVRRAYWVRLQELEQSEADAEKKGNRFMSRSISRKKRLYGYCVDVQDPHNCGEQSGKGYAVCETYLNHLNTLTKLPSCQVVVPPGFHRPIWRKLDVMQHLKWAYQAEQFSHLGSDEDFRSENPDEEAWRKKFIEEIQNNTIVPAMQTAKITPVEGGEEIALLAYTRNQRACMDVVQGRSKGSFWDDIGYAHFRIMNTPNRQLAMIPGAVNSISKPMILLLYKNRPYFVKKYTTGYTLPGWLIVTFDRELYFLSVTKQKEQQYWVSNQCEFDPVEKK